MSQEDRRTVAEVLAQREQAMLGGCCNRFAEMSPCSCLKEAMLRELAEMRAKAEQATEEMEARE